MPRFPAADNRLFAHVYICRKCNAKNRATEGKVPRKCRKCGANRFRLKNKAKKGGTAAK